jgi:hypothetical protein
MTRRVVHDCGERAGRLGLGGDSRVADGARGELDAIPRQHVRGHELAKAVQDPAAQLRLGPGLDEPAGEPARGAHVCVGQPRHGVTRENSPLRVACPVGGQVLASCLGGVALVFGMASFRPGGPVGAEAIEEHRMLLVDVCAAVMLLRRTLAGSLRASLCPRAAAVPRRGFLDGHAVRNLAFPPLS